MPSAKRDLADKMPEQKTLLIVHHSPSALMRSIAAHAIDAAHSAAGEISDGGIAEVDVVVKDALSATSDDVIGSDAIILGTPANFGYISGALKHFFDSTYLDWQDAKHPLPFGYWIRGGHDTTGAEKAMSTITTGFEWTLAGGPVCFVGEFDQKRQDAVTNMIHEVIGALL